MKERVKFVLEWEKRWSEGKGGSILRSCARARGRPAGGRGVDWTPPDAELNLGELKERGRKPHSSPIKAADAMAELLVSARKLHPGWDPRSFVGALDPRLSRGGRSRACRWCAVTPTGAGRRGLGDLARRVARRVSPRGGERDGAGVEPFTWGVGQGCYGGRREYDTRVVE
jgi:hypothetical protein